jgi:recombination protein RecA
LKPLGGQAIKHICSLSFEQTASALKDAKGNQFGLEIKTKVIKNKVSSPGKTANYKVIFGQGIVPEYEVFDLASQQGFIVKSGSWMSLYESNNQYDIDPIIKLQGEDKMVQFFIDNPLMTEELIKKLN